MTKTTAGQTSAGTTAAKAKAKVVRKAKALVPAIARAKAANSEPPKAPVSTKSHPRVKALKTAKQPKGLKPGTKAQRDTAAAKSRDHALTGRSQLNFRG
jgi:hypothetical protein